MDRTLLKASGVLLATVMAVVLAAASGYAGSLAEIVKDDFNDGVIDNGIWVLSQFGTGPSVAETNGRLEVTIPANSVNNPSIGSLGGGYCLSYPSIPGDFDAIVGFQLLTWPAGNGVRLGFMTGKGGAERASFNAAEQARFGLSGPEQYASDFSPCGSYVSQFLVASDQVGKIRLARTNSASGKPTFTAYMENAAHDWVPIGSFTGPGASGTMATGAYFCIAAWSNSGGSFGYMDTKVAFDKFKITVEP